MRVRLQKIRIICTAMALQMSVACEESAIKEGQRGSGEVTENSDNNSSEKNGTVSSHDSEMGHIEVRSRDGEPLAIRVQEADSKAIKEQYEEIRGEVTYAVDLDVDSQGKPAEEWKLQSAILNLPPKAVTSKDSVSIQLIKSGELILLKADQVNLSQSDKGWKLEISYEDTFDFLIVVDSSNVSNVANSTGTKSTVAASNQSTSGNNSGSISEQSDGQANQSSEESCELPCEETEEKLIQETPILQFEVRSSEGDFSIGSHEGTVGSGSLQLESIDWESNGAVAYTASGTAEVSATGLVALYSLDGSGSLSGGAAISDASANANHGVTSGDPEYTTDGSSFHGVTFDGAGDGIVIPSSASLSVSGSAITLSAWVNLDYDEVEDVGVICKGQKNAEKYMLVINNGNQAGFRTNTSSGYVALNHTDYYLEYGKWHHLVGVYDGGEMHIYIDGILAESIAQTGNILAESYDLTIGRRCIGDNRYLNGKLDEVAIWNRALSAQEVADLFSLRDHSGITANSGIYTSAVFDTKVDTGVAFNTLEVRPEGPYGKPMPAPNTLEADYGEGAADNALFVQNILFFDFNEDEETELTGTVTDLSGQANHGSASGGASPMTYVEGPFAQAVAIDGIDDEIVIPHNASVDVTGAALSFSAWVKLPAGGVPNDHAIFHKGSGTEVKYMFGFDGPENGINVRTVNDSNSFKRIDTKNHVVPLDEWFHMAMVYDGTLVNAYVNGNVYKTINQSGNLKATTEDLHIFSRNSSAFFAGQFDELLMWDRALSAEEVHKIYHRGALGWKLQVRSCIQADCSDDPDFSGPDGTTGSFYSEQSNTGSSFPVFDISHISQRRYFQYKIILESAVQTTPKINSIHINASLP